MFDGWLPQSKVGNIICVVLFVVLFILSLLYGCNGEQRYTRTECRLLYPADANQIKAQLALEAGQQKNKDAAEMSKIERLCIMAAIGVVIAIGVLAWLKLTAILFIPISALFGCGSGIAFIEMNNHYPKLMPLLGAGFVLVFAGFAVYYLFAKAKVFGALKEVVGNVEAIKHSTFGTSTIGDAIPVIKVKDILTDQSPSTKSLVAGIRKKIDGK